MFPLQNLKPTALSLGCNKLQNMIYFREYTTKARTAQRTNKDGGEVFPSWGYEFWTGNRRSSGVIDKTANNTIASKETKFTIIIQLNFIRNTDGKLSFVASKNIYYYMIYSIYGTRSKQVNVLFQSEMQRTAKRSCSPQRQSLVPISHKSSLFRFSSYARVLTIWNTFHVHSKLTAFEIVCGLILPVFLCLKSPMLDAGLNRMFILYWVLTNHL